MPTGGAARFASPLSVQDFLKFSTIDRAPPDRGLQTWRRPERASPAPRASTATPAPSRSACRDEQPRTRSSNLSPAAPAGDARLRRRSSRRRFSPHASACRSTQIIKLDANENPYGPSPAVLEGAGGLPRLPHLPRPGAAPPARPPWPLRGLPPGVAPRRRRQRRAYRPADAHVRAAGRGDPQLPADLRHVRLPARLQGRGVVERPARRADFTPRPRRLRVAALRRRHGCFRRVAEQPHRHALARTSSTRCSTPGRRSWWTRPTPSSPARAMSGWCATTRT